MKITNRKAFFDAQILERLEAGINLTGAEVKAVRQGHADLHGMQSVRRPQRLVQSGILIPVGLEGEEASREERHHHACLKCSKEGIAPYPLDSALPRTDWPRLDGLSRLEPSEVVCQGRLPT